MTPIDPCAPTTGATREPGLALSAAQWIGLAAGLGAGALWGLVFVAPRMAPGWTAVDVAAGRFLAFGLLAALWLALDRLRGLAWPSRAQWRAAAGLSVLGFTGYYTVLALAVEWAGTEVPALVVGTIPLWLMLLGKPARLRWAVLAPALLLTALGLALMMAEGGQAAWQAASSQAQHAEGGARFGWGVGLALLSMASWTAFALLNARWLARHPEVDATRWTNWLGVCTGTGALLLWTLLGSDAGVLAAQPMAWRSLLLCAATGIASGWLASVLWSLASQRLSASLCGQLIVSETMFALLYSFWWDGHWPSVWQALAALCFGLGILLSVRAHGRLQEHP